MNQDDDDDGEQTINRHQMLKKKPQKPVADSPEKDNVTDRPKKKQDLYLLDDACEEIKENIENAAQNKKEENYDLNKGLSLKVSSDRKVIQCSKTNSQKLTTVISLRTLEVTNQESQNLEELNPSENRLPIDLIAVIDCSGSMGSHGKMQNCRDALFSLIPFFSEKDRFAIVKFDSKATKVMGLKRVRETENEQMYDEVISSRLKPGGSTSIPEGIKEAINIIRDRGVHKNKIVSVFLLSDGNDNDQFADKTIKTLVEETASDLEFTIHTFGFGDDHDSKLLSEIAKLRNGNFYYIQDLEKINECFVNAFGGLLSIVGRDAKLKLKLEKSNSQIKELSDMKWLKPHGDFWTLNEQTNNYEIDIQNLINGMKRDYVIDIQIPKIADEINPDQREQLILSCVVTAKSIETNEEIIKNADLKAKFFAEDEESKEAAQDNDVSEEVMYNIFRVEVGEMLVTARKLAEENKNEQAIKELEILINKILISKSAKALPMQKLIEQMENAKENVKPDVFNDYGKHDLINEGERTMKQTGLKTKKLKKKEVVAVQQQDDSDSDDNENTIQRTLKRKLKKPQEKPAPILLSTVVEQSATKEFGTSYIEPEKK